MAVYKLDLDDRGLARCSTCGLRHPISNGWIGDKHRPTQYFRCVSCTAVNALLSRHSDRPGQKSVSDQLRSRLADQGGRCALTGEPIRWGYNCSPDHINPILDGRVGARKADRTAPFDLGNIQIVSINANKLKGSLSKDQFKQSLLIYQGKADNPVVTADYKSGESIRSRLLCSCRSRSKDRGHKVPKINRQWIADQIDRQDGRCYWSGAPLPNYQFGTGYRRDTDPKIRYLLDLSIDRLDESIGYDWDNCVICLMNLNLARSGGTPRHGQINPLTMSDPTIYKQWVAQVLSGDWDLDWCRAHRGYLG